MLQYKELLELCVVALNNFNNQNQSVEEYIKTFLKHQQSLDDGDHMFLVEVFSGCVQYRKLLGVVVDGFYVTDGKNSLRSDSSLYSVLCYLLIFRLDELGIGHFRKFLNTQNVNKMYKFLKFFLDDKNFKSWVHDEWCKQYDSIFVEQEIVSSIEKWKCDLDGILLYLEDIINNKISNKQRSKTPTNPRPFKLTDPKPRSIPLPEKIPKLKKSKPVPMHIYKEPTEAKVIESIREENRLKATEKLLEANEYQFQCANPEKTLKTKAIVQQIIEDEEKKLKFNKKHAQVIPKHVVENRPIKMNAAAILREGSLFQKKEKRELEKLDKLLNGAKDATEFLDWQKSMQQKDKDTQLSEMEQRKVQGKISHEEAILARQNQIKQNQEKVSQLKLETAEMMQEYLALRLDEEKQMRTLVEQIIQGHHNAHEAKNKLQQYKRRIVQEVNAESREMMKRALEEAEEEMRRKTQLIQQIRAMESIPSIRHKLVDLTSTAGHALLSEMSIAELRERLCLLRDAEKHEEEKRRDAILKDKQCKNEKLMETLARISTHRNELSKAASIRFEEQQRVAREQQEKIRQDKTIQDLHDQLQQKKEERLRRAEELAVKPNAKSAARTRSLIREKKNLENTRWRQLEMGQQRMAEMRAKSANPDKTSKKQLFSF
uniref:RSP4/6 uncharacterized protein LOC100183762 n=1 Tax=Phallusia mammillata TaxID=59560 RepID=A0A6F9D8G1_9ASCI|nr:RSP4/6 uncharacterized protein LOC100183762 [Phallusia mammillata]